MKLHTNEYKENVKLYGRQLDSKITYTLNGVTQTLTSEQLNSVAPVYQSAILKSAMKELDIDSNVDIPLGTVLKYQFGVLVDGEYEYLNFGNYVVYSSEKQEDLNSYKIKCYDKLLYSMKNYDEIFENIIINYPTTIRDYINTISNAIGLTFKNKNEEFSNYNKTIPNELYKGQGYTVRDVLDELSQVTASTICLDIDDKLEIRYVNETNDTIDENFLKDTNINFEKKYGPVNSIVLSRSAESDNVFKNNPESIAENGLTEIKIIDNQIMNFNDRADYLQDILDRLDGLTYYINDYSSTGITYYDILDKYNVKIEDNTYQCIMFNDEINITQGLEENVYSEIVKETETDYTKADKTDRKINTAYLIVDKQNTQIQSVVQSVDNLDITINNNYQELKENFDNYTPTSKTVELENNVTKLQTDTYTKTEVNTKLTDGSVTKVQTTSGTFDEDGVHYEKTGAKTSSTINESGVTVNDTQSNEELLFAGYDEDLKESIVRTENLTVRKYFVCGSNSRFEDYTDEDGNAGTGVFDI